MAMDGYILKAVKPQPARWLACHRAGITSDSQSLCGSRAASLAFPGAGVAGNQQSSHPFVRYHQKNCFPRRTADQASLLYLSLTRCCAAHTLRTSGPRSTTTNTLSLAPHRGDPGVRDLEGGVSPPRFQ